MDIVITLLQKITPPLLIARKINASEILLIVSSNVIRVDDFFFEKC
jgi:hypothetical protein